jgi:hypothetical protein
MTPTQAINDNDNDILEIILNHNLSNLKRVASTCTKWNSITLEFRDEQKMKYLKSNTNTSHTELIKELELEIFNCSSGYNINDDEIPESWRDLNVDWEENWQYYREYTFFYDYKEATYYASWR